MMMDREVAVQMQAKLLCLMAGFDPIDSMDGSPNWWMFNSDAEKIVDDMLTRFPPRKIGESGETSI